MSTTSSSRRAASDRQGAIRRIVMEVAQQRSSSQEVADEEVVALHPQLMPELAEELRKLRLIDEALAGAEDQRYDVAWRRLEADSHRRNQIGSETDDFDPRASRELDDEEVLSIIGRYQVVGLLGEGGFARVYHAKDEELQRDVAIKVPYRRRGTSPEEMEAYWAEARIVAALDHPAIVPVYDVGRTRDGHCYVVSKLIRGENLAARLRRLRPAIEESVQIVLVVADALQYAHVRGLIHRDIKPANILLDAHDHPYVVDFGLALTECDARHGSSYAGTPGYMSPEQARGETHRIDARSDIFSLGVVLYELLTGRKPFDAEGYDELLQQVLWEDPPPLHGSQSALDEELERIVGKTLSKRAVDRYANVAQLIDDLQHWQAETFARSPAGDTSNGSVNSVSKATATPTGAKIIPRGLRSFDANDADFYLTLLPGPRDRSGLPESIRQWKTRIEDPEPSETFAVGLIYGPSGCGKSSLVRAGLLPRLSPRVRSIYLQATADDTEVRLRHRIARQFPDQDEHTDLTTALAEIRHGRGLGKNEQLLLVIDQFEQWLHGRAEKDRRELLAALRQCDGQHLSCLLLVRDDFWLAVGRFMTELEIELVQGFNSALVDLFDLGHAQRVLCEFGRAYGQLPDDLSAIDPQQRTFLRRAVQGLASEDRVIPVRLALFAEMVKNRPWTPDTLREVGGAEGVGVAFLEETFCSRTANPRYRLHQDAVRSVLGALLPDRGSDIRGRLRSNSELLDISGYGKQPDQFQELMRILDSETRLLTPADLDSLDTHELKTAPGHRYYQLTHDYLVPNLREWLTARQKSTRRGRLELRLAERSRLWSDRPESRQLPSLLEYISIRLFTRPSHWTVSQRRLMQTARRRNVRSLLLLLAVVVAILVSGGTTTEWVRNLVLQFRARSAMVAMVLGRQDTVWPLLRASADPTQRTEVLHAFGPLITSPEQVLAELPGQEDVGVQRAMTLVAGELVGAAEEQTERSVSLRRNDPVTLRLRRTYRNDPDPGLHAAAYWTLVRFQMQDEVERIDNELTSSGPLGNRRWYVNSAGHTMVVVPGWTSFVMGSAPTDTERASNELQQLRQISHSFFLSSQETTVRQFATFLSDPDGPGSVVQSPGTTADASPPTRARTATTWYEAAAYCNWLSAQEKIPASQWCYLPNADGQYGPGMRIATDFAQRQGYRLPTEAEWEFACRAGTTTRRFFGRSAARLAQYAACGTSEVQPVGQYKPNDLGLFDMLGNAAEWCQDVYRARPPIDPRSMVADYVLQRQSSRVLRGASASDPAARLRSASRDKARPDTRRETIGFRVARSNL